MENEPATPGAKEYYFPEELGLDADNQADLDLYVQSEGDKVLGIQLISQRAVQRLYLGGLIGKHKYEEYLHDIDVRIAQRRKQIGSSSPRP